MTKEIKILIGEIVCNLSQIKDIDHLTELKNHTEDMIKAEY